MLVVSKDIEKVITFQKIKLVSCIENNYNHIMFLKVWQTHSIFYDI